MLFSFVVALMVILIAAFWTYQGFFSSLIMFFEAVVACMVAFGFYENIAGMLSESIGQGLALSLSFLVLFFATLAILRVATDKLIKDSVSFPVALDRAGAGVAGLFSGLIIIGCTMVGIQMLPIGSGIFGFERFQTNAEGEWVPKNLGFMFRPDEFACGLAAMLSNDRFGGDERLSVAKPDMVIGLYSARAVPMSEETMFVNADDVKVTAWWRDTLIDTVTHTVENKSLNRVFEKSEPKSGKTFLVCHVQIAKDASGKNAGGEIRFRLPQFRIVGPAPSENSSVTPRLYLAVGMSDIYTHRQHKLLEVQKEQRVRLVRFAPTTDFVLGDTQTKVLENGDNFEFDVAFEVPDDFQPWYLEFKHGGRAELKPKMLAKERPAYASYSQGTAGLSGTVKDTSGAIVGDAPGGTLHGFNAIDERTGASDDLPIVLSKSNSAVAAHLAGDKVGGDNCAFWAEIDGNEVSEDDKVTKFSVPDGKRMVQIGADILKQENYLSRAIGFANRMVGQTTIKDDKGNAYYAVGFYVAMEENGKTIIEFQYDPTSEQPERALKKPTKFTHAKLSSAPKDKIKFGFLFVVDPGVKIVEFSPNGKATQQMATPIEVPN